VPTCPRATTGPATRPATRSLADCDGAIAQFREAVRLKPGLVEAHHNLGNALWRKGDFDGAIAETREAIRLKPDLAEAHSTLGSALYDKGDVDGAIVELREAIRIKPDYAVAHCNLGNALYSKGDIDAAIAECREAIRLDPDLAEAHVNLGRALARQGRLQEAGASLRRGLELRLQRELGARLPDVLASKVQPRDVRERIEFAMLCYVRGLYAASARLYGEAFQDPALGEDLRQEHRYNAACAATLAAAEGGDDAAMWRAQALEWLRADLASREELLLKERSRLEHWKRDRDLTTVRDRIDELPEAEREGWRKLWADVDALLARAQEGK
jgi:Flp pilus assembly protein TadD